MATTVEATETSGSDVTTGRARWARLAALGLTLAGLGPLLMLAGALAWGLDVGDEVGFFLVSAALAGVGAVLLLTSGTWRKVVGILTGLVAGFLLFWTAFGLASPDSFFDFIPGVVVLPGALLGAGAGIAAIRAERRDDVVARPASRERTAMRSVIGVVGVLVVMSTVLTFTGRETVGDDVVVDYTVELSDFEFDVEQYSVEAGSRILVRNKDPFVHTFTVDDLDIDVSLSPGSEKVVTIPDQAGQFILYCEPHTGSPDDPSDDDMAAVLEVS